MSPLHPFPELDCLHVAPSDTDSFTARMRFHQSWWRNARNLAPGPNPKYSCEYRPAGKYGRPAAGDGRHERALFHAQFVKHSPDGRYLHGDLYQPVTEPFNPRMT